MATAFTLARILSNIPLSRGGPTSVVIFDIHALQVCRFDSLQLLDIAVNRSTARLPDRKSSIPNRFPCPGAFLLWGQCGAAVRERHPTAKEAAGKAAGC